jgi:hypothetical protein
MGRSGLGLGPPHLALVGAARCCCRGLGGGMLLKFTVEWVGGREQDWATTKFHEIYRRRNVIGCRNLIESCCSFIFYAALSSQFACDVYMLELKTCLYTIQCIEGQISFCFLGNQICQRGCPVILFILYQYILSVYLTSYYLDCFMLGVYLKM